MNVTQKDIKIPTSVKEITTGTIIDIDSSGLPSGGLLSREALEFAMTRGFDVSDQIPHGEILPMKLN